MCDFKGCACTCGNENKINTFRTYSRFRAVSHVWGQMFSRLSCMETSIGEGVTRRSDIAGALATDVSTQLLDLCDESEVCDRRRNS